MEKAHTDAEEGEHECKEKGSPGRHVLPKHLLPHSEGQSR